MHDHELTAEAAEAIARDHGAELAACDGLLDFALEIGRPWRGRSMDRKRPLDGVLAAIFARSTNTYWASIELGRIGFGEQAATLNRLC